jgi:hypothetical protein
MAAYVKKSKDLIVKSFLNMEIGRLRRSIFNWVNVMITVPKEADPQRIFYGRTACFWRRFYLKMMNEKGVS